MSAIVFEDFADDRARLLAGHNLNGMRLVLVALPPGPNPDHADLDLRFFNDRHLAAIMAEITANPVRAGQIFRIRGGTRVLAGPATGQVKVTAVAAAAPTRLSLRVEPVGDYSTYTLDLLWDASLIDPFFSSIGFKFRPGCFTNDCAPALPGRPPLPGPAIDYLAKDYDSFRHTLMVAMADRVPGWQSTSEADHDQVLIDLFAAAADELSDYQDRVMNEAYLATARKRVTLARQARLVDYHLHEGNQASTWLAVNVVAGQVPFTLADQELVVWSGPGPLTADSVVFMSREHRLPAGERQRFDPLVNRLRLYTWGNAQPALRAGSTSADVVPDVPGATQAHTDALRDLVRNGGLEALLIAEQLNPLTGAVPGHNPRKRQLLRLLTGTSAAETILDPLTSTWLVRLNWRDEDALRSDYSFTTFCSGTPVTDVSLFFGNLVMVHEGRPMTVHFYEDGALLPTDTDEEKHRYYQRLDRYVPDPDPTVTPHDWVVAALPEGPLAYLPPPAGAPGEVPAHSTLHVEIEVTGGTRAPWNEVESLVHSNDQAADFMVETDERQRSILRLGNGTNGMLLPRDAIVHTDYQVGGGHGGNVGTDQLTNARPLTGALAGAVTAVFNPFDVADGSDPETPEKIRRNAPEAYRTRQLRAVTLADYVRRAEEVPGVLRAVARYAWTGSWRTVRVVIDPAGTTVLDDAMRQAVSAHLESVRLIGEDIELRPPRYVPLELHIVVCADPAYWREDIRFVLEQEFSSTYTSDGRLGFFHPDAWTFGQALHRSAIEGRIQGVAGIEHVVRIIMKRFNAPQPGLPGTEVLEMGFDEVVLCANDPDHLERGLIRFVVQGGRQ
jgi:hypothetical protein